MTERSRPNFDRTFLRREERITTKHDQTTCFACRGVGHAARDCPNVLLAARGGDIADGTAAMLAVSGGDKDETGAENGKKDKGKDGMKRGKGKKGGELTTGRCYR